MLEPLLLGLVQRVGDPPPMLTGTDTLKLCVSIGLALLGLGLVLWSLRPGRR